MPCIRSIIFIMLNSIFISNEQNVRVSEKLYLESNDYAWARRKSHSVVLWNYWAIERNASESCLDLGEVSAPLWPHNSLSFKTFAFRNESNGSNERPSVIRAQETTNDGRGVIACYWLQIRKECSKSASGTPDIGLNLKPLATHTDFKCIRQYKFVFRMRRPTRATLLKAVRGQLNKTALVSNIFFYCRSYKELRRNFSRLRELRTIIIVHCIVATATWIVVRRRTNWKKWIQAPFPNLWQRYVAESIIFRSRTRR